MTIKTIRSPFSFKEHEDIVDSYVESKPALEPLKIFMDAPPIYVEELKKRILTKHDSSSIDVGIFYDTIKHIFEVVVTVKEKEMQTNQQDIDIGIGFMEEAAKYDGVKLAPSEDTIAEALKLSIRLMYSDNNSRTGAEVMTIINDAYGQDVVLKLRSMSTEDILRRLQSM